MTTDEKFIVRLRADLSKLKKDLLTARRLAATSAVVPVTFTKSARSEFFLKMLARQIASTQARITPTIDQRPFSRAMGQIRSEARRLAREPATIKIQADTKEAERQLRHFRSLAGRPLGGRGGAGGHGAQTGFFGRFATAGLAGGLAGGAISGGAALAAGGAAAGGAVVGKTLSTGIGSLADIEKTKSVLSIILKDGDKAAKLFAELEAIDLKLPADLQQISQAATKLAASGFAPESLASDLTTLMDTAAASSVGLGEGLDRLTRAFGQIRANGRLMGEELLQISDLGINVERVTQSQWGMSSRDLAEKSQNGEISIDEVIDGLLAGFRTDFGGSLEAQSKLLIGQLDQAADQMKAFSRSVSLPLMEPLKESLESLNSAMNTDEFDELTDALVGVSEAAGPFIAQLGMMAELAIKGAGGTVNAVKSTAPAVATEVAGLAISASKLYGNLNEATGGLFGDVAKFTAGAVTPGKRIFDDVTGVGKSAVDAASDFVVNNQTPRTKEPEKKPTTSITEGLTAVGGNIAGQLGDTANMFQTMADSLGASMADRAAAFGESTGIDFEGLPKRATMAAADLQRGDVLRADEGRQYDAMVADLPKMIQGFAETIDDPAMADAFKRSTFDVTQERDGNGRMMPVVQLKEIGELMSRGSVERTDFAGLNTIVQKNVDQQRDRELAEKRTALAEKSNEFLQAISAKLDDPRSTTVAAG
ncbi:hypothetical protein K227x_27440 [Rubripirellula lacrimiformis]|uniref:Tape measure protein N-terminal domain-containing protein n=1 Tax=Rubripirellula lacrimiformis TaxID=1930273 RepID=A0A517NB52_9BACT|nr:tape measure protein [Rubripirellula lacrimiformis]QDT04353.1 hypothetical protein K227x_27440 [Rubripirellula lacrimiformis]